MFHNMTSSHKLVLAILFLGVAVVLVSMWVSWIAALAAGGTLLVLLWVLRGALLPPGYGANKVRVLSLTLSFALIASYGAWSHLVDALTKVAAASPDVKRVAPWLAGIDLGQGPSIALLAFFGLVVWIVNHYMADRSIGGGHPVPLVKDFPDLTFNRKLEAFCSALRQHLVTTDREANWSPDYYADLEAEVEVVPLTGAGGKRRIVDLQRAFRSDRPTQAFLVLGDPGAGKSVALRKLARDMLDEVGDTGRIPIYVNLREWLGGLNSEVQHLAAGKVPGCKAELRTNSFSLKNA